MAARHFTLALMSPSDVEADRDQLLIIDNPREDGLMLHVRDAVEPVWDCGSCGVALMIGVQPDQGIELVVRCPTCRAYNQTLR
jgi:hypothetical protein